MDAEARRQTEVADAKRQSQEALARYNATLSGSRLRYFGVLAAIIVVVLTFSAVVYSRGEAHNTSLRTTGEPAQPIAAAATNVSLRERWRTSDKPALGTPFFGGTVVTYSLHSLRGRDGRNGKVTWSYTRSNRDMCSGLQTAGVAIAVFRVSGNCDELTALDAQTGRRLWTRTLDEDGVPLNGSISYQIVGSDVLFISATAIYAVSTGGDQYSGSRNGGIDLWVFSHFGCTIKNVTAGPAGVLIAQVCSQQRCAGRLFCRQGAQLLLRPLETNVDPNQQSKNRDRIIWNIPGSYIPIASAATLIAFRSAPQQLEFLSPSSGRSIADANVSLSASDLNGAIDTPTSDADILWIAGHIYCILRNSNKILWTAPAVVAPTVSAAVGVLTNALTNSVALSESRVLAHESGLVVTLGPLTGAVNEHIALPAGSGNFRPYPLGTGLLALGESTAFYA